MNNKGFTLVELLATIAILAILIAIAVPSVESISSAVRERNRNNTIKKIEIAASKYAFDTGKTIVFVDELVKEGYIESDDEEGNIVDTVNNKRLNCYIVEMEKKKDYYNAKFIDNKDYDNDGICDESKLNIDNANIRIEVLNNGVVVNDVTKWLKGTISLRAYSDSILIDCSSNKCSWTSSSGASYIGRTEINLENVSRILETRYTFQMTTMDDDNSQIKRYTNSVNLKIDNEAPKIYENEIKVTDRFINTAFKNVTITASDGKGSGIEGYYLGINNGDSCTNTGLSFQENDTFKITSNGNYLVCVKDRAGNISSYGGLNINHIS